MAINTISTTSATNFLQTVWHKEVAAACQANVVFSTLVDRQFEADMKFGKTVVIRNRSNPAVRFKSQDVTATYSNVVETQQTITVNLQAYCAFIVDDVVDVQSDIDLRSEYTDAAGYSLMSVIEGDATSGLVSMLSGFDNNVGTLGADPTIDTLIDGKSFLDRADVPMSDRSILFSPGFHNALLKIDPMVSNDYREDAASANQMGYFVKPMYGAKVAVSTLLANNPNVAGQSYGWFGHRRGLALIIQREPRVHEQYILLETGTGVLVDVIYNFAERSILPKTLASTSPNDAFNCGLRGPA